MDLVAISVPMHTSARLGLSLAERIRRRHSSLPIAFYGLYASLIEDYVNENGIADAVVGGEYEVGLGVLADNLSASNRKILSTGGAEIFPRQKYFLPDRSGLPTLDRYARFDPGDGELRLVGYVETTRGCAHRCTHCPLTSTYKGRLRIIQQDVILRDIEQLVSMGAQHITFGDPDFFNAIPHSIAIVQEFHRRYPKHTFDATIKVQHILEHVDVLSTFQDSGLAFVTSAFESLNDELLVILEKEHSRRDLSQVIEIANRINLPIRPTWLPFTPWTSRRDLIDILTFIDANGLSSHVQPVQYALRLLLPPGSPLISLIEESGALIGFDPGGLTYTWRHPDPEMDRLQRMIADYASGCADICAHENGHQVPDEQFVEIYKMVQSIQIDSNSYRPLTSSRQPRRFVPGLTESWFC